MGEDDDKGGIVLGSIGFGVGAPKDGAAPSGQRPTGSPAAGDPAAPSAATEPLGARALPLRVIAVAELLPSGEHNAGGRAPSKPIAVEPGHLDALFGALGPRAVIEVESVLEEGKLTRVELQPRAMKSFRPDGLLAELPLLASLLAGRSVLEQLRDGTQSIEGAREQLARIWSGAPLVERVLGGVHARPRGAPAPVASPDAAGGSEDEVARILSMVGDGGGEGSAAPTAATGSPAPAEQSRFGALIAAVAHSGKSGAVLRPDQALDLLDRALSLQLGAILQHPEIRRLEQAWRGLALLTSRMPKRGVRLEVLSCPPDGAAEALEQAVETTAHVGPPVSLAVVDDCIGGDAASLGRWRELAEVGERHAMPVIVSAAASLLGQDDLGAIDRLDNKQALFDTPASAPWRAAAARPASLWLALALNPLLARTAYDRRSSRVRTAQVQELPADEGTVWLSPCWAVASLALKSFAATGWPCRVTGARQSGLLEDLPVREVEVRGSSERIAIPTEVFICTETQRALGRLGLTVLASQPNSDSAYLLTATTSYVPPPKRTDEDDTAEPELRYPRTPLGDQLFVARLAHLLRACGAELAGENDPATVRRHLEATLHEALAVAPPPGPELSLAVAPTGDGLGATVTIRPRRFLGVGMEEITLGVPLG